jgi:hypothetical protein
VGRLVNGCFSFTGVRQRKEVASCTKKIGGFAANSAPIDREGTTSAARVNKIRVENLSSAFELPEIYTRQRSEGCSCMPVTICQNYSFHSICITKKQVGKHYWISELRHFL